MKNIYSKRLVKFSIVDDDQSVDVSQVRKTSIIDLYIL